MTPGALRVGLVGAGYIADWHADAVRATPGLALAGVVDAAPAAARRFAEARGVPAYPDLAALAAHCDAVHVLTPPASHAALAAEALRLGLHVLVEKPMALSAAEVEDLSAAAHAAGRQVGVCHNFLGLPSHERLTRLVARGGLGRLMALEVTWALPFPPLQSGPYGIWPLRAPENLLWELGPHPFAFAVDLLGPLRVEAVALGQPAALPGEAARAQGWRVLARAGAVEVNVALSLAQTHEDRSLTLRGSSGLARLDYAGDVLVVRRDNAADLILNPLLREASVASQHLGRGLGNAARQALTLNRAQPYALSFRGAVAGFYEGVRSGRADPRFAPGAAAAVARAIEATLEMAPPLAAPAVAASLPMAPRAGDPVAVVGGTGFIGRALVRTLAARGTPVRVLSRGGASPFPDLSGRVETVSVALDDEAALSHTFAGCRAVVNLARAQEKTFGAALESDVAQNLRIARAAAAAGATRLVHAGTIASYDMSDPGRVITEDTPFGAGEGRNPYARAKAEGERRLVALCAAAGLPLVIARPGIVVGREGPLQHWGIGRWHGAGAVRLWNHGRNVLPFVLVDDVADGIVRMLEAGEGSFNLVGEPMLSARDYFDAIADRLGARVRVAGGVPAVYWAADAAKSALKRHVLRRADAEVASLADWRSRAHLSPFDNRRPKEVLGWRPEADRAAFLRRAVDEAGLFGL